MLSTRYLCYTLFAFPLISNAQSSSATYVAPDPASRAKHAVPALQTWYNKTTGLWETTGWWNGANIVTMLGDYAKAFPADAEVQTVTTQIFSNALARAPMKNPQPGIEDAASYSPNNGVAEFQTGYFKDRDPVTFEPHSRFPPNWRDSNRRVHKSSAPYYPAKPDPQAWLDGYYDDDLWWALAWINAYDVTHHQQYLDLAEGIFLAVAKTWGTYCGNGGIYWSWEKNYVNAIANELFFSTAAHLANRIQSRKKTYLDWAKKSLDWFFASGMINSSGTINDGLTEKCQNNGKTTWSYNQGVILGGLVELHRVDAYPKYDYFKTAHDIALAALKKLSDHNGVIHDVCEPNCGADGAQFKGIFMRNLYRLHQASPNATYAKAIRVNGDSIWANDRVSRGNAPFFSVNWAGPYVKPENASTHSSAMDALVAAAVTKPMY